MLFIGKNEAHSVLFEIEDLLDSPLHKKLRRILVFKEMDPETQYRILLYFSSQENLDLDDSKKLKSVIYSNFLNPGKKSYLIGLILDYLSSTSEETFISLVKALSREDFQYVCYLFECLIDDEFHDKNLPEEYRILLSNTGVFKELLETYDLSEGDRDVVFSLRQVDYIYTLGSGSSRVCLNKVCFRCGKRVNIKKEFFAEVRKDINSIIKKLKRIENLKRGAGNV